MLVQNLTAAIADRASHEAAIRLGAGSMAFATGFHPGNLQIGGKTAHRIFKRDFEIVANILATLHTRAAAAAAAESVAETENVAQDIPEIRENGFVKSGRSTRSVDRLMTIAVVRRPLLRITQDAIRLGRFLELLFRFPVARVAVRMVLERQLAIGTLERLLIAIA